MLVLLLTTALTALVLLPVSAFVLDGSDTGENAILPVAGLLTLAVGAALGPLVLRGPSRSRAAWTGVVVAVAGALVGISVFWFALNGLDGA